MISSRCLLLRPQHAVLGHHRCGGRGASSLLARRYMSAKRSATTIAAPPVASEMVRPTTTTTSFMRRLWDAYAKSLNERPLLTKAAFASIIFFCSDSATQYLIRPAANGDDDAIDKPFRWDAARALSGAGFGIVATGWLHYWWGFLEAAVGKRLPVTTYRLSNTATKVFLDQAIGAPLYIYSYYVLTNFFSSQLKNSTSVYLPQEEEKPSTVWDSWLEHNSKAAEMLWPTMLQHWRVWIPVHSFNFYYVPLHHRVLVQNTILVFWSGYLSHLNHREMKIMSPDEEIQVTIVRKETERKMKQQAQRLRQASSTTSATN